MLTLQIKEKEIENLTPKEEFVRGTVGAECQILLDDFWGDYENTVVFKRDGCKPIKIPVDNLTNTVTIPHTILAESGSFKIGLFGVQTGVVLPTLWSDEIKIRYGTDTNGTAPPEYEPDEIDYLRANKQDTLVSGENIKTINGENILGEGDIEIQVKIEIDQTYNPESENAQSGKAVAEAVVDKMDKFADVTIENEGKINKKIILDILKAQFEIIGGDLYNDGDFSKLALLYGSAKLISSAISGLYGGADGKIEVAPFIGLDSDFWYAYGEPMGEYPIAQIVADFLGVKDKDGNPIRIINVADPKNDLDVANKQYVDRVVKPQKQTFEDGETITITDNTEYIASEEITNLTIIYPDTDFICSFNFTLASTGNITITLPESKYIGSVPSFVNGETWELNIKNGVVVGGKVE